MNHQAEVLNAILCERNKQDETWGVQDRPPCQYLTILGEEYGEACQAALDVEIVDYH